MSKSIRVSVSSFSETDPAITDQLTYGHDDMILKDGIWYVRAGNTVYSAESTPEGNELLKIIRQKGFLPDVPDAEEKALNNALTGHADVQILQSFGIKDHVERCVILFRFSQYADGALLRELIPLDSRDRIVITENGDAALLMHTDNRTEDEILEFAAAAAETVESEAGITCFAGIGRPDDSLERIATGFLEAEAALNTGLKHRIPGRAFAFSRITLERLADSIPLEKASALKKEIVPECYEKLMTEEMLETIRTFFRNDLNLSTTARKLFIHRNTLIYRMEKIRKVTGLDLRKFDDAVVFRMLMSFSDRQD